MKLVIFLATGLISVHSFAMTNAEICSYRGRFVESAAQMRDAGKTEAQTLAEVKKQFTKHLKRPAPASMDDYVAGVYAGREYTPSQLGKLAELMCRKELG